MQLFPERPRSDRRSFRIAVVLSLALNIVAGYGLWLVFFGPSRHVPTHAEDVAVAETVTILRVPTPTPAPTATPVPTPVPTPRPVATVPPTPHPAALARRPPIPVHRRIALPSLQRPLALMTAPPAQPRVHERHARVHVPRAERVAFVPRAEAAPKPGFDPQQIAALDARFRNTIADAQRAVASTPQPGTVRTMKAMRPTDTYLNVDVNEVIEGNGDCVPVGRDDEGQRRGIYTYYYLSCIVHYKDGYVETVAFPWPFKFTDATNPFRDGRRHSFPGQPPPPGFVLQHPFALSRAVCAFYQAECQAVIDHERAAGLGPGG